MPSVGLARQVVLSPPHQASSDHCCRLASTEGSFSALTPTGSEQQTLEYSSLQQAPSPGKPEKDHNNSSPNMTSKQHNTGAYSGKSPQPSSGYQAHPLQSPPYYMPSTSAANEPIYVNTNFGPNPDPESLTLTDNDFGDFVSGFPQQEPRLRSSSFTFHRRPTGQHANGQRHVPTVELPSAINPHMRFEDNNIGRANSVDNLAVNRQHPSLRLTHSHTLSEIPHLHALSNDSGYDTPTQRPRTSPSWLSGQHPQWVRQHSSQQYPHHPYVYHGGTSPSTGTAGGPVHSSSAVPMSQSLTIDVGGHFHEEPEPLTLDFAEPQSYPGYVLGSPQYVRGGGGEPRYSMSTQRSMTTLQEEGVVGYQKERKDRLQFAYDKQLAEYENIEREAAELLKELEKCHTEGSVDISTEKEVGNLRQENANLKKEIKILDEAIRRANETRILRQCSVPARSSPVTPQTPPNHSTPPSQPPVVSYPQEGPEWACPRCTLLNNALLTSCEACDTTRPKRRGAS